MFKRLAASFNIAFTWFSMFDLDHTFSPNNLRCKQMFDCLVTTANKACVSRKKKPIRNSSRRNLVARKAEKRDPGNEVFQQYYALNATWAQFVRCLVKRCLPF